MHWAPESLLIGIAQRVEGGEEVASAVLWTRHIRERRKETLVRLVLTSLLCDECCWIDFVQDDVKKLVDAIIDRPYPSIMDLLRHEEWKELVCPEHDEEGCMLSPRSTVHKHYWVAITAAWNRIPFVVQRWVNRLPNLRVVI